MERTRKIAMMPILTPQMDGHGPLIYTRFKPKDNKISSLTCLALVDTGASGSVIDCAFIESCVVKEIGKGNSYTPHGSMESHYYSLDVSMCGIAGEFIPEFSNVIVSTQNLGIFAYKFIIGRDILSKCTFIYDGRNKVYSLEWD